MTDEPATPDAATAGDGDDAVIGHESGVPLGPDRHGVGRKHIGADLR